MDMYELKFTKLESELFSLLCSRAGEKLSQREIAKILKASPTAVSKLLKNLQEKNLAKIEKIKTINFTSLNRDEPKAIELKRVENLKIIYLSGLADYLEEKLAGSTIILFGSFSRGEDAKNSDIDIAVIGRKDKILKLEQYENRLNRKINVGFYDSWKSIHKHLKNSILNGILLHGSVEL